jgi:hypothetical protein
MKDDYYSRTDFLRRKRGETFTREDRWVVSLARAYALWRDFF